MNFSFESKVIAFKIKYILLRKISWCRTHHTRHLLFELSQIIFVGSVLIKIYINVHNKTTMSDICLAF